MKTPTNLVLTGAKDIDGEDAPQNGLPTPLPAEAAEKIEDDPMLYGTVIKSWTSGGMAITGAKKAMIAATYPVVKNPETGAVDFAGTTFELDFTDVDNQTSSTIPAYAFTFTGLTPIPQPAEGGEFDLVGTVRVSPQPFGRLLFVDFNMSGGSSSDVGSTPTDIGAIFVFDIPADTVFEPKAETSTA